jgi:hypothetical protein
VGCPSVDAAAARAKSASGPRRGFDPVRPNRYGMWRGGRTVDKSRIDPDDVLYS